VKSGELKSQATAAFERYLWKIGAIFNGEKEEANVQSAYPNKRMKLS